MRYAIVLACSLSACSVVSPKVLTEMTSTRLGAEGGTATSPDGLLALSVAPNRLEAATDITIEVDRRGATPIYRLGPRGLTFAQAIEISVKASGELGSNRLVIVDADDPAHPRLAGGTFDPGTRTARAPIMRLVSVSTTRESPRCDGLSCGDDCSSGPARELCDSQGACVPEGTALGCGGPDAGFPAGGRLCADVDGGIANGGTWVPCVISERLPNNTLATAQATGLGMDEGVEIVASWDGDDAYFSFVVPEGERGSIIAHTQKDHMAAGSCFSDLRTDLDLLDSTGRVLASARHFNFANCGELDFEIEEHRGAAALTPGIYALRVHGEQLGGTLPLPYIMSFWLLSQRVARVDGGVWLPDAN